MIKSLVLPARNEETHIADIVRRGLKFVDRVIVVDNNSSDQTYNEAKKAGAITLRHCSNLGKASSLKTGCEAAIQLGTDVIALMDADGQHKPEDLPRCFDLIEKEQLDIVIGSRCGVGKMPLVRWLGNQLLKYATQLLFKVYVEDIQSGFRVFRANIYDKLKWKSRGSSHYFADAEMTVRIGKNKLNYKEIFIDTIFVDKYKGMTVIDGLRLLFKIFIWRILL